jgi:hypothetical protein
MFCGYWLAVRASGGASASPEWFRFSCPDSGRAGPAWRSDSTGSPVHCLWTRQDLYQQEGARRLHNKTNYRNSQERYRDKRRSSRGSNGGNKVSNRTASTSMDIRAICEGRCPSKREAKHQRSRQCYKTSVSDTQAIPRIQPLISETLLSCSVRLGLKNRPRLPSRSLRRSHSTTAQASC